MPHELNPLYLSGILGHAVQTEAQTVHRMHHGCIVYQYEIALFIIEILIHLLTYSDISFSEEALITADAELEYL